MLSMRGKRRGGGGREEEVGSADAWTCPSTEGPLLPVLLLSFSYIH